MALNRFVGLGILALSAMAVSLAACDDSSSSDPVAPGVTPVAGVGGSTGTPVTPGVGVGGVTGVTQPAGAGGTPVATTPAGTTPVAPAGDCSAATDFVAIAAASEEKNWVDTTANGCGISGAFYGYSDTYGSLVTPAPLTTPGGEYASPCGAEGCCIEGNTVTWIEMDTDGKTPKYTEWGAGLGFSLSDPGAGGAKLAYTGAVKGFKFTITGATEAQDVFVKVKHTALDSEMPPLVAQTVPGSWDVTFLTDAKCANYPYAEKKCTDTTDGVYDVQIQVNGGTVGGAFKVCLTSLTPIL